jgi:hypothetical protein
MLQYLESVQGNAAFLSNVFVLYVFHLGIRTTGRIESENSSVKSTGVNPTTKIVRLARFDVKRNENRVHETKLRYQREANAVPFNSEGYEEIARQITKAGWELFHSQVSVWSDYIVVVKSPVLFEVFHRENAKRADYEEKVEISYEDAATSSSISVTLPYFNRVRRITVIDGHLSCSCPFFSRYGIPCRHMLAVNKGQVSIADFHFRWTTAYVQGKMDSLIDDLFDLEMNPGATQWVDWSMHEPVDASNDEVNAEQEEQYEQEDGEENEDAAILDTDNAIPDTDSNAPFGEQNEEHMYNFEHMRFNLATPVLRYQGVQACLSEIKSVATQFLTSPEATAFFLENFCGSLKNCYTYMMEQQSFTYEDAERGSVVDPLTLNSTSRSNRRTKRKDEHHSSHSGENKRRHRRESFFRPSAIAVEDDLQFESVLKTKGRPKKVAEPDTDSNK